MRLKDKMWISVRWADGCTAKRQQRGRKWDSTNIKGGKDSFERQPNNSQQFNPPAVLSCPSKHTR